MKKAGKDPEALRIMPRLPLGFPELLRHFNRLSGPNPIDFLSVFYYNQAIARLDLEFFLEVIQMLDTFYLNKPGKQTSKGPKKSKG